MCANSVTLEADATRRAASRMVPTVSCRDDDCRQKGNDMSRVILSAIGGASLLVPAPALSQAQYDLTTCTGNYNYCLEQVRRVGRPSALCESAYQDCMRKGTTRDLYNPYNRLPVPVERR